MFLLLSFLLSSRAGTCALPILLSRFSEASIENPLFDVSTTASTGACAGRSLWDILWSCLATTFACTWVSVHPNIPFVRESKLSIRLWRVYLMLLSLIAPEIMILWAFKQLQGAIVIKKTVNEAVDNAVKQRGPGVTEAINSTDKVNINKSSKKGDNSNKDDPQPWTLIHAHYLQMGGFRLQCLWDEKEIVPSEFGRNVTETHGGKKRDIWELPLSFETMKALVNSKAIDLPFIKKEEILDKCGRDALSKTIALLQLTWFIIQIAARARQSLAVTELELTTAALASLNIAMYISWWSKPTDILCPTDVKSKRLEVEIQAWRKKDVSSGETPRSSNSDSKAIVSPSASNIDDTRSSDAQPEQHANHIDNASMVAPSQPGSGYVGIALGNKVPVNLVTHYWDEFWNALQDSVATIASFPTKLVTKLSKAIPDFKEQVRQKWRNYFNHEGNSTVGETILKSVVFPWETIAHIFLALIYYPILAILESGNRFQPSAGDATSPQGSTYRTNDADGSSNRNAAVPNNGIPSSGVAQHAKTVVTPESVDKMNAFELIFNKDALRLVMDMVFFCEDVASAPFFCLSALSGAIFGMIHCLAWNFDFPSHVEQILWRTCSSVIAGLCVCIMAVALGYIINQNLPQPQPKEEAAEKSKSRDERTSKEVQSELTSSESQSKPTPSKGPGEHASPDIPGENISSKIIMDQNRPQVAATEGKKEAAEKSGSPDEPTSSEQNKLTPSKNPSKPGPSSSKSPGGISSWKIIEIACSIFAICFVLTRISLISLSIIQLRALPASAFEAVQWSGFIPHI